MIEYEKFRKALRHLEAQFQNRQTLDPAQPALIREAVAESVVQRFETCYDCLWKVLKRYLAEELGIPDLPNSPKPLFRLAFENHLLQAPIESWLDYAEARIGTSHGYSGQKDQEALDRMGSFIEDAKSLLQAMSGDSWT